MIPSIFYIEEGSNFFYLNSIFEPKNNLLIFEKKFKQNVGFHLLNYIFAKIFNSLCKFNFTSTAVTWLNGNLQHESIFPIYYSVLGVRIVLKWILFSYKFLQILQNF